MGDRSWLIYGGGQAANSPFPESTPATVYPTNNIIKTSIVLMYRLQKKEHKKRSMASIPFTLADGVDMGINV